MPEIVFTMSVSTDGFIETAGGDISFSSPDPELQHYVIEQESAIDADLNGRRLYETLIAYWPTADENPSAPKFVIASARIWKDKRKSVFTKTLTQVGGLVNYSGAISQRKIISEKHNREKTCLSVVLIFLRPS
jgi:hypothetical protein